MSSSDSDIEEIILNGSCSAGSNESNVCAICGDHCLGYHYSVLSCEGCKGFFKRSVQMNLEYRCKYAQACVVDKSSRNACQYCRFQKCLKCGMKREAVRDDRSSGGKNSSKRQRTREGNSEEARNKLLLSPLLDTEHQKIIDIIMGLQPDRIPCRPGSVSGKDIGIQEQLDCTFMEVKFVIEWAKQVPYFNTLTVEDQMALLKSTFIEINMLRLSYRSMKYPNCMYFADGIVLDRSQIKTIGWGNELVQMSMDFTSKITAIQLNDIEYALMKVIVLTYPDAIGLVDKQSVIKIQTRFLNVLSRYVSVYYPHDKRRLSKILMRLPALRMFGAKAQENVLILSLEGAIQMDELVQEMML
ncbi:retinoic acid receptor RXR-gamma-like isoform X2 [Dreissena polymorpha]|uniref:Uncharacterized protein n=1 Tax=Dreissena polymorpha TaxID=45954 RepID=A0A9D4M2Q0_DREPO|nr:retinoic acid receptor RXR-gamma-like isoform X2 [Dreissena polymorpha]XP_052265106.1 retinoic acid receptor RXR-gamma-like isoform X2 [Dreissena polymorpha]KAH3868398.1 hypothetical protein DPMN_031544 [Dreissena polymorpha]